MCLCYRKQVAKAWLVSGEMFECWREKARTELGETEEALEDGVHTLREKIRRCGKSNIHYETESVFLERFLRCCKFDVERAFAMVTKYYEMRHSFREKVMPRGLGPRDTEFFHNMNCLKVLPTKNKLQDGSTVISKSLFY